MFKLVKELSDQFKKSLKDELLGGANKKHKEAKTYKKVMSSIIKNQKDIEFHWYVNEDSKNEIITNNDELESIFHNLVDRDEALKFMSSTVHCLLSIGNLNNKQCKIDSNTNRYQNHYSGNKKISKFYKEI